MYNVVVLLYIDMIIIRVLSANEYISGVHIVISIEKPRSITTPLFCITERD